MMVMSALLMWQRWLSPLCTRGCTWVLILLLWSFVPVKGMCNFSYNFLWSIDSLSFVFCSEAYAFSFRSHVFHGILNSVRMSCFSTRYVWREIRGNCSRYNSWLKSVKGSFFVTVLYVVHTTLVMPRTFHEYL